MNDECRAARDKGLYYLQYSARTVSEMEKKLSEKGFSPEAVDDAVGFLKEYHYLDDVDYTRQYIERSRAKKSERAIRNGLISKGVPRETIDEVFEAMPSDETDRIRALLKKKYPGGIPEDKDERRKAMASFSRKGYTYDAIRRAFGDSSAEDDYT